MSANSVSAPSARDGRLKRRAWSGVQRLSASCRHHWRLLGLWAASRMRLKGDAGIAYAETIALGSAIEPAERYVVRTIAADLRARGLGGCERDVRRELDRIIRLGGATA